MSLLRGQPKAMGRTASSGGLCAQSSTRLVNRPCIAARLPVVTAAAADTETAAAAAAPEPAAAPLAEAAAAPAAGTPQSAAEPSGRQSAAAGRRRGRQAKDSSTDSEDEHIVRIGAETVATKVAAYLFNVFKDRGSDYTLRLQAAGAPAYANALKAMARLQQMLANEASTADRCVVFKPRGVQILAEPRDGQPAQRMNIMRIVLSLAPRSDWPAAAFEPTQNSSERSGADAAPSAAVAEVQAAQESSSSSKDSATNRHGSLHATPVRPETAEEQQRLEKHITRSSELNYPSQFSLAGGRAKVAAGSAAVMYAVDAARQACLTAKEPSDLCCTVVTQSYAAELPARSQEQGGEAAAAAAAAADTAAGDSSSSAASSGSSSSSSGTTTVMLPRFYITVQSSAPDMKDVAAAHKQQQRKQRYQEKSRAADGRDSSRGPVSTRPGYVEVREEEWNQLKEQLQVVPHLTEQLQIMTRQHEQLLSLLAAQQSQQQGSD